MIRLADLGHSKMSGNGHNGDLKDISTNIAAVNLKDEDAIKRSRQAGWAEPAGYDYEAYKPMSVEDRGLIDQVDLPTWAADADKFEWKEEYAVPLLCDHVILMCGKIWRGRSSFAGTGAAALWRRDTSRRGEGP